jgi:hypothetical protein
VKLDEFDQILESAKMPEKDIPLCLRGDLQAEWEKLEAELKADLAARKVTQSATLASSDPEPSPELSEKIRAVEAEMAKAMVTLKLRAMARHEWFALVAAHPPREDVFGDRMQGFNGSTIWDDLITDTLVDPKLDKERVTKLLDKLTPGQTDRVANEAWVLNRRDTVSVPFSPTASRIIPSSGEISKPPPDSESPTGGGQGGSRKKSPATSTTKKAV